MKTITQAEEKRNTLWDIWGASIHLIWTEIVVALILVGLIAIPKIHYNAEPNLFLIAPLAIFFVFLNAINLRTDSFE